MDADDILCTQESLDCQSRTFCLVFDVGLYILNLCIRGKDRKNRTRTCFLLLFHVVRSAMMIFKRYSLLHGYIQCDKPPLFQSSSSHFSVLPSPVPALRLWELTVGGGSQNTQTGQSLFIDYFHNSNLVQISCLHRSCCLSDVQQATQCLLLVYVRPPGVCTNIV